MGCRIIEGFEGGCADTTVAVLFCSTTGWAFGPLFEDLEDAQSFLDWLSAREDRDPRNLPDHELGDYFKEFRKEVSSG